ncbi:metallophosphoesterase [Pseudomonas sp. LPH60]|uniref:AAA family ATPase n=1 Tax=Pseudomonas sp. LPH60 TaxID=3065906 RepID=UPI00273B3F92|nr:AAA family ATPase [Pseudomonas sp. LPH60]MDP4567960.1 metallophosphoesterase [Pseudomonas sp. LPH60]
MSAGKELIWLHLSDIHFHPKTGWRDDHVRRELLDFLQAAFICGSLPRPHLVFCTGDIAFGETSGAPLRQQYEEAASFFDELLNCCGLPRERLFMVPGNHDVNRIEILSDQQDHLIAMADSAVDHVSAINQRFDSGNKDHRSAMERLKEYGQFVQGYRPELHWENYHLYAKQLEVDGWKVGVAGFNSAWSCAGPEDDRHVWLAGQWQFNYMANGLRGADLKIGLIHHPFDWLNVAEHHEAEQRASKDLHFLLHGHTHTAWVRPTDNCVQVAAGATGASTPDQFGINLTRLNRVTGECCIHLYTYQQGWVIAPVAKHAPIGQWHLKSGLQLQRNVTPESVVSIAGPEALPAEAPEPASSKRTLFGRDGLLKLLSHHLREKPALALYGMRGNGKSELIRALHQQEPLASLESLHITVAADTTPGELFRQLLNLLNDHSECPVVPEGSLLEQIRSLQQRYPNSRPACIWIDRAHLLLADKQWKKLELFTLVTALRKAFANWYWIFELRERPEPGSFGADCHLEEVPGLDKLSLSEFLNASAPSGQESEWSYSGQNLKSLYQWLGGGHGQQAHPLATRLLIEVAYGKKQSPWRVYQHLRQELLGKVEEGLLGELYRKVLAPKERDLLQALALYRVGIPHDHADWLEEALSAGGGWQALERRCLLPVDAEGQRFYLHGFISSWICREQLKTAELEEHEDQALPAADTVAARLHLQVGRCWQRQLGNTRRLSSVNIERANEACHHLLNAGATAEMGDWVEHLLRGQAGWSAEKLWGYEIRMHANHAPLQAQVNVLQLLVRLHPRDPKAWSFLGEGQQKISGLVNSQSLQSFEHALELSPENPRNLANLGKALRARGPVGAEEFLRRLAGYRERYPEAINDYVLSIEADCLEATGQTEAASLQRNEQIKTNAKNPVAYNDEASYQLVAKNDPKEALRILELAECNRSSNDHTDAIRGKVLEALGEGHIASELRWKKINAGNLNPVFYADEANYQLEQLKDPEQALNVLRLMEQRGIANAFTQTLRSKAERRR